MKRNLIYCPTCKQNGVTNVLGEVDEHGHFLVLRFHKGMTRIVSDQFGVICGRCTELVFIRKRERTPFIPAQGRQVGTTEVIV
ncbi:MAG: hypothetical protein GY861_29100 [bacterium]|nr:hypothetical protein [bacterium]